MFEGKIGFVGLGISNYQLLKYLIENYNIDCFVSENSEIKPEFKEFIESNGVDYEESGNTEKLMECDSFIVSPGVNPNKGIGKQLIESGKPFTTELEVSLKLLKERKKGVFIGITGTNGKSTTVTMLSHIFRKAGARVFTGGNLGNPLAESLFEDNDFYVIEVSSFQLKWFAETRQYFSLSAVLNISEDHLDYHHSKEDYALSKLKIISMTGGESVVDYKIIENYDWLIEEESKQAMVPFSMGENTFLGYSDSALRFHKLILSTEKLSLRGLPNHEDALVAIALANFSGIDPRDSIEKLQDYVLLDHRVQYVTTINEISFYDDSKATNANSVEAALSGFSPDKTVLILGGVEKKESYSSLIESLSKLKGIVVLGSEMKTLLSLLKKRNIAFEAKANMASAVEEACSRAKPGDFILLSPGGSSFDLYKNYRERGIDFVNIVKGLTGYSHEA